MDENLPELVQLKQRGSAVEQRNFIFGVARQVVERCGLVDQAILGDKVADSGDKVHNYALVFAHYASLALEFYDAWGEGDGERIIRCWRVLLLHFYTARRTKYCLEALLMQFQMSTLTPQLAHQLQWSRFVNAHGGKGCNIPCDLFNEHVNALFKAIIANMGANLTEESVRRAARSVTGLNTLVERFDNQTGVPVVTSAHSEKSDETDVSRVVAVLQAADVMSICQGRKHSKFSNISSNPLKGLEREKLITWMESKKKEALKYSIVREEGDLSDSDASEHADDSDASDASDE